MTGVQTCALPISFTVGSTQVFLSYHDANMYIGLETFAYRGGCQQTENACGIYTMCILLDLGLGNVWPGPRCADMAVRTSLLKQLSYTL